MITEHALLPVVPGQEEAFEVAFARARPIIASMPGFLSLSLSQSVESPSTYLLLVEWDTLEDHTVGFRGSPDYQRWRALLHRFYEPFPVVEHYSVVSSVPCQGRSPAV
ncbi:antibiotic biosynthesis monooxygenase [Arthrobacter sp. AB6]|uniref:antibiotic biosynthesis monooxygenase family protein n=1 Tax=Arthrobacter sp. AB6 TaxID=2962570 RepID=UPI002880D333|nr:antibiotic biosynthesis monooxygenase [Arthrobacter sp. AB6]MDT0194365.1 antibiotic biosynthesis monooxygenase [Arthrobacter sp. AB6]